ncbi:MAG: hypothetical protein ACREU7_04765 [Burkholderiales bacterium]
MKVTEKEVPMRFTIAGAVIELTSEEVERRLVKVEPEEIRQVFVEVRGKRYPVKQALAAATPLIRSGFTTQDANRVFRKLGFKLGEI